MLLQSAANVWTVTQTVGTLLSGAGAISVLVFMSKQIKRESRVAGCEFILKVSEGYDSQTMKVKRARLANALISSEYLSSAPKKDDVYKELRKYASPVLGYFEDLGMMLRQKLVPTYFVWVTNGVTLMIYYEMMQDYIACVRRKDQDPTYYKDFEYLYQQVKAFDRRHQAPKSPLSGLEHLLRELGSMLPWTIFAESESSAGMAKREFLLRELDVRIRPFDPSDVNHTLVPPLLRDRLLKHHEEHYFLAIAEILNKGEPGHEYLGYLVGTIRDSTDGKSLGEIVETFVDSRFRKKGIGERLCMYFCERLKQWDIKGCKVVIATTDEALTFYTQIGFTKGTPLINKFEDGRDAYELTLNWV